MLGLDNVHFYVHRIYSGSTAAAAVYLLSSILSRASKRIYVVTFCILFFLTWTMINKQTSGSLEMCKKRGKQTLDHTKKSFNTLAFDFEDLPICLFDSNFVSPDYVYFYTCFSLLSLNLSQYVSFSDLQPTDVTTHIVYHLASLHITKHQILLVYYLDNKIPPQLSILHFS